MSKTFNSIEELEAWLREEADYYGLEDEVMGTYRYFVEEDEPKTLEDHIVLAKESLYEWDI